MRISKGSHFGEIDILLKQDRFTSVIAEEECELLSLNKKHFSTLFLKEFK
jgi:CRP-like cAMP-binding protein